MEAHIDDIDRLSDAFNNDSAFRTLLNNRTFSDYLNTFLSLPVFAVRVMYRCDNGTFELEQPVSRTVHHLINENIVAWVRVNRGWMFLKTSICNEYRFCATLLNLPVNLIIDEYNKDDLLKFQLKCMAKVIDMQRLKAYMKGSYGESLITFWLDAERFRRHVPKSCRRFVLQEINAMYLIDGAVHELSFSVRENIKKNLKHLCEERNKAGGRSFIKSTVLLTAQNIALRSLQEYWIPKYLQHRLKRRRLIKHRWGKVLSFPQKLKDAQKKKGKLLTLVDELKQQTDTKENTSKEDDKASQRKHNTKEAETNSACSSDSIITEREKPRRRSHSISVDTRPSKMLRSRGAMHRDSIATESNSSTNPVESSSEVAFPNRRRTRAMSEGDAGLNVDRNIEQYTPLYMRVCQNKENNEDGKLSEEDCLESQTSNSKLITLETPAINEMEYNTNKDQTFFTPLFPPIAAQDIKSRRRATTFFESVYEDRELHYEADNEDNTMMGETKCDMHVPLVKTLQKASKSFIATMIRLPSCSSKVQQPYSTSFVKKNTLSVVPDEDHMFSVLVAALTTDQVAGQPLLEYFRETDKKIAESNLKFWTASNDILTDCRCNDPTVRQKQYHTLIHLHLSEFSGSHVSLSKSVREELCVLLPKDLGVTKLMEATNNIAVQLLPEWDEFLKHDKGVFLKSATKEKRKITITAQLHQDTMLSEFGKNETQNIVLEEFVDSRFDDTLPDNLEPIQERDTGARVLNCKRMWRAMELAICICKPKHTETLIDTNENEKWTTDESDESEEDNVQRDKSVAGSLAIRPLEFLNKKAERLQKLEQLFNKRHHSLAHDYNGTNLLKHIDQEDVESREHEDLKPLFLENARRQTENQAKPPRPRCFQDLLTDPLQYEHFKRFLTKEKEDTPLLFWTAVESMRTTSRSAKARQGRTHGIVKRYFGPAAMHGKELKCNADIIKEIPYMEKVTPAMLVSAQACVSKTMEESWFAKYLLTFQDTGGTSGITSLPIYGVAGAVSENTRSVKQKTRGLWRMFTRNVISFRRGILTDETLKGFTKFLELQHNLNLDQANANNQTEQGIPPRIVVNNKLVHTEKLTADLNFWSEVERYKDFADAVVLCAKLGNYTKDDELIVVKKAKTIVDCFIDSQIPPRVQLNISNDLAENVIQLVQNGIIERGLFHEAALSTFSTLIYFWKKYCLHRFLPVEQLPVTYKAIKVDRSAQILTKQKALKTNKIKKVTLPLDEECTKLMFSLQLGLRLGIQKSQKRKLGALSECFDSGSTIIHADDSPVNNNNNIINNIKHDNNNTANSALIIDISS